MGFTQARAGAREQEEGAAARPKEEENGLNQVPGKKFRRSQAIMVDDDDVQLCMGKSINQPKKKHFKRVYLKYDVILR